MKAKVGASPAVGGIPSRIPARTFVEGALVVVGDVEPRRFAMGLDELLTAMA
jgi:hypothetical protein